jgi:hypothetical protein
MSPATDLQKSKDLEGLITDLSMLLYGWDASTRPGLFTPTSWSIADLYHMFAGTHLITSLFLVDKEESRMGGVVFRVLSRYDLEHWLEPIASILDSEIGKTTFGDVIRLNRNRLMTHGDFSLESLPAAVQAVTHEQEQAERFRTLMEDLMTEVFHLRKKIETELGPTTEVGKRG